MESKFLLLTYFYLLTEKFWIATKKHSESANIHQGQIILCFNPSSGEWSNPKSFGYGTTVMECKVSSNHVLIYEDPDWYQNSTTFLSPPQTLCQISLQSMHNSFISVASKQTKNHTHKSTLQKISFFAKEVNIMHHTPCRFFSFPYL